MATTPPSLKKSLLIAIVGFLLFYFARAEEVNPIKNVHKVHRDSNIATFGSLRIAQRIADVDQEWRVFEMILWILWSSVRKWRWGRSMCHQALIVDGLFGHGCG